MGWFDFFFNHKPKERHIFLISQVISVGPGLIEEYAYGHEVWEVNFTSNGSLEEESLKMIRGEMKRMAKKWEDWKIDYKYEDKWFYITKSTYGRTLKFS